MIKIAFQTISRRSLLAVSLLWLSALPAAAQDTVEWLTLGSDYAHTRSTTADQIRRDNLTALEMAWSWDGASFKALSGRSTPSYVNGMLYTVAGERRHVIAIDPERYLYAVDKTNGEQLGKVEVPRSSRYGMMSYVHQGRQYILLQTGGTLTAMALPGGN